MMGTQNAKVIRHRSGESLYQRIQPCEIQVFQIPCFQGRVQTVLPLEINIIQGRFFRFGQQ